MKTLKEEICSHKTTYLSLLIILFFGAFFRLYKLDKLLGFWYDQGRDALVIWDLLHYKKFFLIGPVTGIEGIFLGPFYYYLLAPLYWLGKGSPVFAAAGLVWLTIIGICLLFYLAKEIFGHRVALVTVLLYGLGYTFVQFSRWLANPNPLPVFTLMLLILLNKSTKEARLLIPAGFILGLCLQLEAAAAIFFIPAVLLFLITEKKKLFRPKILLSFLLLFFLTLLPQIVFNFRHQGILLSAFKKFLITEKSFHFAFINVLKLRLILYYNVFFGKLFPYHHYLNLATMIYFFAAIFLNKRKFFNQKTKLLWIWLLTPLIGFFFYQGNNGYIWDYYLFGVLPIFVIFLAVAFDWILKRGLIGKIGATLIIILFTLINLGLLRNFYKNGDGITLGAELKAIDWIYSDAGGQGFNIDVYVPPQISYSYSYLFKWYGAGKYEREPETKLVKNLYTLSEPDSERPQFLAAWLQRQDGIGKIVKRYSWGYVSVEKRERLNLDE